MEEKEEGSDEEVLKREEKDKRSDEKFWKQKIKNTGNHSQPLLLVV